MKRFILALALVLVVGLILSPMEGKTRMGSGMMGPGMMGGGMMGPGMMGPGYRGYEPQYQQPQKLLEEKDAKGILENYLRSTRNPNLKLGKITEKDNYFESEILTKDNSLVEKIIVDKYSGWMRSIGMMEPGMMSGGMMGPGMMGGGMMGGGMMGRGMGPGMMGPGMMGGGMMGPGYAPQYGPQYQQPQKPLEEKDVKVILENYLRSTRNPNLKLGKVTEKDNYFELEILTKDNSVVEKIIVDKYSGWMRSIGMMGPGMMGPGMMGGGMMGGGMMGPGYAPQYGPQYEQPQKPLEEKDAKVILENYLRSTRNPNLKPGKITEKENYFESEILTKDNSLVEKIIVDKYTGLMRSAY